MARPFALFLTFLLAIPPAAVAAPRQADPADLRLEVIEGNGALNNIAAGRARDIVVKVVGPGGQPVEGAVVSFVLPASGPGATFTNGARTSSVSTGSDGLAAARGLRLNDIDGQFEVRVSTVYQNQTARATVVQTNVRPAGGGGSATKVLLIVGLIAGAAAGAAVALGGGSGSTTPSPNPGPTPSPTTIAPGTPVFGAP